MEHLSLGSQKSRGVGIDLCLNSRARSRKRSRAQTSGEVLGVPIGRSIMFEGRRVLSESGQVEERKRNGRAFPPKKRSSLRDLYPPVFALHNSPSRLSQLAAVATQAAFISLFGILLDVVHLLILERHVT